jgi:hypothetical protein
MSDSQEKVEPCGVTTYDKELDMLKTLRACLEAIKQVVQGVHDDLVASQNNYAEMAGIQLVASFVLANNQRRKRNGAR